jgi:SP family general alpha glucoside:H+ symporter-like MFS transporter
MTPLPLTLAVTIADIVQGVNLGGKCGYVWGATGLVCLVMAYFYLPEMKGRSYREIDILFKRRIPARKWKETVVDVQDDE